MSGRPRAMGVIMAFNGDFDALPMAAALYYSMPPEYPTEEDMQGAMMDAANADPFTWKGAAQKRGLEE